ncbi:MAG: ribosomal-processing cysteine protease Prp [Bacilli bacterium]|nr:ribosomal-processing cysteine protease Prp [Bacilli bacterium]
MIKVTIVYKGKGFESIEIKGHANTAEYGKDLVCAAVSACAVGAINALSDEGYEVNQEEGKLSCISNGATSEHDLTVLETLIVQLKTIEMSNKGTIDIKERKK